MTTPKIIPTTPKSIRAAASQPTTPVLPAVVAGSAHSTLPRQISFLDLGPRAPTPTVTMTPENAARRVASPADALSALSEIGAAVESVPPEVEAAHRAALARSGTAPLDKDGLPPFHAERLALAKAIIAEEDRDFDPVLVEEYRALQKKMIATGNMEAMPRAKALLLQMHGLTQEIVDAGFAEGGAWYSYRNTLGSICALLPLAITFETTRPHNQDDPTRQAVLAGTYLVAALTAAVAGVGLNARALLQATPFQDAAFNGAPNIALELAETPGYKEITGQLEALAQRVEGNVALNTAKEAFKADPGNAAHLQALKDALDVADTMDHAHADDPGRQNYLTRAQLHHVYIGGLAGSAALQTGKVVGNIAAGWAGVLTNPRVGAYVQLAVSALQIVGQRAVAPSDQVRLQNLMWEMKIMLRKLTGDEEADRIILKSMVRTPLEVRATTLENLTQSYVEHEEQTIGKILHRANPALNLELARRYRSLRQRQEEVASHALHATQMASIVEQCHAEGKEDMLGLSARLLRANADEQQALIAQTAVKIGMAPESYWRHVELERKKAAGIELADEESRELAGLAETVAGRMADTEPEVLYWIAGVPGLLQKLEQAEHSRDHEAVESLCAIISDKTGVPVDDFKEFYFLDTHRCEPLTAAENEELVSLQAQIHQANQTMSAKDKADYIAADDTLRYIARDPLHIRERRFGAVSHVNAGSLRNGMQVTRLTGWSKYLKVKPEARVLLKEGHRRAGNAPEYISTFASGIWRAFQLGVTGANGPLILNGIVGLGRAIAKAFADDPVNYKAPWWPYVLTTAISLGAWVLNSVAAHRVAEAKIGPLSTVDQLAKAEGATSPIAETIIQVGKFDERTAKRNDPRFNEKGVDLMLTRYLWPTVQSSTTGLAMLWKGGTQALHARRAFEHADAVMKKDKDERASLRSQIEDIVSANANANANANGSAEIEDDGRAEIVGNSGAELMADGSDEIAPA